MNDGVDLLKKLQNEEKLSDFKCNDGITIHDKLFSYLQNLNKDGYLPLSLFNAVERFSNWEKMNFEAEQTAREQSVYDIFALYRLEKFGEVVRYEYFRRTYFKHHSEIVATAFAVLLAKMSISGGKPPIELPELPDLQSVLENEDDLRVFSKMVFPKFESKNAPEILKISYTEDGVVLVLTHIVDKNKQTYSVRPPMNPIEIGELYRLFYRDNFPHETSDIDRYLVAVDSNERVVGGLTYKLNENNEALIDGTVVTNSLKGRGIGTALIHDFCSRMASNGVKIIRTYFLLRDFYISCGFKTDKRFGALVKFLNEEKEDTAD